VWDFSSWESSASRATLLPQDDGGICGNQNPKGLRFVESHFSQRTREMGHPLESDGCGLDGGGDGGEKQVPRLRKVVLRTILLRSG
jgi:hypothetical protein